MPDDEVKLMRRELLNFKIKVSFHDKTSKGYTKEKSISRVKGTYEIVPLFEKSDYYKNLHKQIKVYHRGHHA
jgi:hypothetical protein